MSILYRVSFEHLFSLIIAFPSLLWFSSSCLLSSHIIFLSKDFPTCSSVQLQKGLLFLLQLCIRENSFLKWPFPQVQHSLTKAALETEREALYAYREANSGREGRVSCISSPFMPLPSKAAAGERSWMTTGNDSAAALHSPSSLLTSTSALSNHSCTNDSS